LIPAPAVGRWRDRGHWKWNPEQPRTTIRADGREGSLRGLPPSSPCRDRT
jgi:hypothetical protein